MRSLHLLLLCTDTERFQGSQGDAVMVIDCVQYVLLSLSYVSADMSHMQENYAYIPRAYFLTCWCFIRYTFFIQL